MKTGFFEDADGNKSNSRRIGFITVIAAIIFAQEVLFFGRDNVILAATAAGTIFLTIAGPVLTFLFKQKQTENISNSELLKNRKL